jgi:hypothetical protein
MNQVIHQLKLACLSYTQSPITYHEKEYTVSELLKVKAEVISSCQRLMRDFIIPKNDAEVLRSCNDERAFVIEPLLHSGNVSPRAKQTIHVPNIVS